LSANVRDAVWLPQAFFSLNTEIIGAVTGKFRLRQASGLYAQQAAGRAATTTYSGGSAQAAPGSNSAAKPRVPG